MILVTTNLKLKLVVCHHIVAVIVHAHILSDVDTFKIVYHSIILASKDVWLNIVDRTLYNTAVTPSAAPRGGRLVSTIAQCNSR